MLTILNKLNKQQLIYEYEDIYEGMKDVDRNSFFKQLYDKSKSGDVTAYCSCVPEKKIPLVISKRNKTYYIKRLNADTEHSLSCKFDGSYNFHQNAWNMEPSGEVFVYLKKRAFSMMEHMNPKIQSTLDLHVFLKRFIGYAHEIQMKQTVRYGREPMGFERFFHSLYYVAGKIKFTDNTTLKSLMGLSKKASYELLKKRHRMFVLLIYQSKRVLNNDEYLISLSNPGQEKEIEVVCNKKVWEDAYSKLPSPVRKPIVFGGFVELKKNSPLIVKHVALHMISQGGVVVSDLNDRKLTNKLYFNKRYFVNSFETFVGFKGNEPDILLLDTHPNKAIVIFKSKDKDYLLKKESQIKFLKKELGFPVQVWDVVNKEKLYFI